MIYWLQVYCRIYTSETNAGQAMILYVSIGWNCLLEKWLVEDENPPTNLVAR